MSFITKYSKVPSRGSAGGHSEKAARAPAEKAGHGRKFRGFAEEVPGDPRYCLDADKLPKSDFCAFVAPRGFLEPLLDELGKRVITVFGRLVLAEGQEPAFWAQTMWLEPQWLPFSSIKEAARKLTGIQRNWRAHIPYGGGNSRRSVLIESELPHMSCRPLNFGDPAPTSPVGAFTLWTPNLMLASAKTSSVFPDGEVHFNENKTDPPGRAYLKLWESFTRLGIRPAPGALCVDLGASPGSWTWVLASIGCRVFSIDKAPLATHISGLPNVNHCVGSGFALTPQLAGHVDWLFSDMICYPSRLLTLVQSWIDAGAMNYALCTLKFQSDTDMDTARAFAAIPGSKVLHLSCNRHELTWFWKN